MTPDEDPCSVTFEALQELPDNLTDRSEITDLEMAHMDRLLRAVGAERASEWAVEGPLYEAGALTCYAYRSCDGVTQTIGVSIEGSMDLPTDRLRWEVFANEGASESEAQSTADYLLERYPFVIAFIVAVGVGLLVWRWTGAGGMAFSAGLERNALRLVYATMAAVGALVALTILAPLAPRLGPDLRTPHAPTDGFRTLVETIESSLRSAESPFREIHVASSRDSGA